MDKQSIDLHKLISIVRRHRNWVYFTFGIAIIFATILNLVPPTYEAKVTIRVQPTANNLIDNAGINGLSEDMVQQKMNTYAELIKSRTVVKAAVGKLSTDEQASLSYEKAVNQITVRPLKDTEILNLFVLSGSPQEARDLANALAVAFDERLLDIVRAEGKETRIFIGDRLIEKKRDLDNAEKALVDYKKNNQIVEVSEQAKSFVDRQSLLKSQEADNQLALEAAYAKLNTPSVTIDTPVVQAYRTNLAEQEVELAGLLQTMTDQNPRVISLQASIAENRKKLQDELRRTAESEVALTETQRATLQGLDSQEEQALASLPGREIRLARLMLDYSVAQDTYTVLAKRYEEARINEIMEPTNVQIFDMAALPEDPVAPKKFFNLCIAAFLGLFIGTLITFVVEYFGKTIDTAEDLQQYLPVRMIGSIPRLDDGSRWKIEKLRGKGGSHG